uniref:Uncharacterized protein n=1 Tax=Rhizophora mucronata TaxID=61149 RepID=A0A2P2PF14_RHIMU
MCHKSWCKFSDGNKIDCVT